MRQNLITALRKSLAKLVVAGSAFVSAQNILAAPSEFTPLKGSDLVKLVADRKSKVTVVNMWATWCPPCKEEMPELLEIQAHYAKFGTRLVLVTADNGEDLAQAAQYLKELKAAGPLYRLDEDPEKFVKAFDPQWTATLPATFIFDRHGKRTVSWIGRFSREKLEAEVKRLIADKPEKKNGKKPAPKALPKEGKK